MSIVKKTVSISSEIVDEARVVSPNFSWLVEAALREYLQHYYVKKAMESFGKWDTRDVDSVTITNELREEKERGRHVKGSH